MQIRPSRKKVTDMEFTGERFVPGKPELTHLYQEHMSRYMFAAQFVQGKRVLDLGCGCGYGSCYLAKHGATEVIGIDNSEEAVKFSQCHYDASNLDFEVQDATAIRFDSSSFDVVVAFELIEHLRNYERMLSEVKRVLRRDGVFIISTPNKATFETKDEFHFKEFYYDELKDVLSKYFRCVKITHQMYPSALAIQNSSQSEDIVQVEIARAPIYAEVSEDSLYFVAACSDIPLPEIKEYIYLFPSRTILIENYKAWKNWIKQLQQDINAKDVRIIELQREFDERTEWALRLRDEVKAKDVRIIELQRELLAMERDRLWHVYQKAKRVIQKKIGRALHRGMGTS